MIKILNWFCFFCFENSLDYGNVRDNDDMLVVHYTDEEIVELYSATTLVDENDQDIVGDTNKLNLNLINVEVLENLLNRVKEVS